MVDPWLWTAEELIGFCRHHIIEIRRWAQQCLAEIYPEQAGDTMVVLLDDPDSGIRSRAAEYMRDSGDAERYAPVLLDRLQDPAYKDGYVIANMLAELGVREALPIIIDRLRQSLDKLSDQQVAGYAAALGLYGGEEARAALWELLGKRNTANWMGDPIVDSVLLLARPQDFEPLIQHYRTLSSSAPLWSYYLRSLARSADAERLFDELQSESGYPFNETLEIASEWSGQAIHLREDLYHELQSAFRRKGQGVPGIVLGELRRMAEERGDDIASWFAAWEAGQPMEGYRRRMLWSLRLLEALVAAPSNRHAALRFQEDVLALALFYQLFMDQDDERFLEGAAARGEQDYQETLFAILVRSAENVLPDIVDRVVALGPGIVPRLETLLDPHADTWGNIRVLQAIAQMARQYPGSCDQLVPLLIETVDEDQAEFILEESSNALRAIGRPTIPWIAQNMEYLHSTRSIYFAGVLEHLPTESAAQAILQAYPQEDLGDEMISFTLRYIGSPSAIEPLRAVWLQQSEQDRGAESAWMAKWLDREQNLLAQALYALCEVNGVRPSEFPVWQEIAESANETIDERTAGMGVRTTPSLGPTYEETDFERELPGFGSYDWPEQPEPSSGSTSGKKSGPSKKERKRRETQRRKQRKKR